MQVALVFHSNRSDVQHHVCSTGPLQDVADYKLRIETTPAIRYSIFKPVAVWKITKIKKRQP